MPYTPKLSYFLFIFLKFIFNWRIISLQCFISFCCTITCISHKCIYLYSLSLEPLFPHLFYFLLEYELPTHMLTYAWCNKFLCNLKHHLKKIFQFLWA